MKIVGIILIAFWLALTVLILYSALVAASEDEERDGKYQAEHFWKH